MCTARPIGPAGFGLRSGVESSEYFDKYRFESDPSLLREICAALLPSIPPGVHMVAGLELGGVPLATVLGQMSGLPVVFVRKRAKESQAGEGIRNASARRGCSSERAQASRHRGCGHLWWANRPVRSGFALTRRCGR